MVTKIILVRHGETHENKAEITQGQFNSQLNDTGKEQVKSVALRLKNEKIEMCYSSDLDRCMNTAKEIVRFHPHLKITPTKELREQAKGEYEGVKREVTHNAVKKLTIPYVEWDYDGAESFIGMNQRTMKKIYEIVAENKNKTILIVAHGGQIASIACTINGEDIHNQKKRKSGNTSVTLIEFDDNKKGTIKSFDCNKHLSC